MSNRTEQRNWKLWALVMGLGLGPSVSLAAPTEVTATLAATTSVPLNREAVLKNATRGAFAHLRIATPLAEVTPLPVPSESIAPVPSPSPSAPAKKYRETMTKAELLELTSGGFEVSYDGIGTVKMYGKIFKDCEPAKNKFKITAAEQPSQKAVGFMVRDPGGAVRACMEQHKKDNDSCDEDGKLCVSLSNLGGNIRLAGSKSLDKDFDKVGGIVHIDPARDREPNVYEDLDPALAPYQGSTTRARIAEEERAKRREQAIKDLESKMRACRRAGDYATARELAQALLGAGGMTMEDFEKIEQVLEKEYLASMLARAEKGNPSDFENLREELKAYSADHPEAAKAIAVAYQQMAGRLAGDGADTDSLNQAGEILREAQTDINGLDQESRRRFNRYEHRDLPMARAKNYADQSNQAGFQQEYGGLMKQLDKDFRSDCSFKNTNSKRKQDMESCSSTITAFNQANQLPAYFYQVQRQQAEMYQRMLSSASQQNGQMGGMNGGMMNGMSPMGGMNNMNGGMMNGMNGQMSPMMGQNFGPTSPFLR